jgi:hypothetical protein
MSPNPQDPSKPDGVEKEELPSAQQKETIPENTDDFDLDAELKRLGEMLDQEGDEDPNLDLGPLKDFDVEALFQEVEKLDSLDKKEEAAPLTTPEKPLEASLETPIETDLSLSSSIDTPLPEENPPQATFASEVPADLGIEFSVEPETSLEVQHSLESEVEGASIDENSLEHEMEEPSLEKEGEVSLLKNGQDSMSAILFGDAPLEKREVVQETSGQKRMWMGLGFGSLLIAATALIWLKSPFFQEEERFKLATQNELIPTHFIDSEEFPEDESSHSSLASHAAEKSEQDHPLNQELAHLLLQREDYLDHLTERLAKSVRLSLPLSKSAFYERCQELLEDFYNHSREEDAKTAAALQATHDKYRQEMTQDGESLFMHLVRNYNLETLLPESMQEDKAEALTLTDVTSDTSDRVMKLIASIAKSDNLQQLEQIVLEAGNEIKSLPLLSYNERFDLKNQLKAEVLNRVGDFLLAPVSESEDALIAENERAILSQILDHAEVGEQEERDFYMKEFDHLVEKMRASSGRSALGGLQEKKKPSAGSSL